MAELQLDERLRLYSAYQDHIRGNTASGEAAAGLRTTWIVDGTGTQLSIWDTTWSTAEREVVLGRPEPVPAVPLPVAQLMGRRRASVDVGTGGLLFMTVRLVLPDPEGWPRFRRCDITELTEEVGEDQLDRLFALGVRQIDTKASLLGATGRSRTELCASLDPKASAAVPALYLVTRVLPTLRRTGML